MLTGCGSPLSKSVAIPTKADYNLIPVYTLDGRSVYLNAAVTPLEFFSVNCPHCQKDIPQIQTTVNDLKAQKPLIYVSTFLTTSNVQQAIQETKDFITKYKLAGTVVIQAGPPQEYVKAVPSLVMIKSGQDSTPDITVGMPSKEKLESALDMPMTSHQASKQESHHAAAKK
jgi:thiol-disulfide isomerase/thioredoxin